MRRIAVTLVSLVFVAACATTPDARIAASDDSIDSSVLLAGGRVFSGDDKPPLAAGVLIRDDRIVDVGAPGCVSATANLNAGAIARVIELFDRGDLAGARAEHEAVKRFRMTLEPYAPIPAQKSLLATASGDGRWADVRPPFVAMPAETGHELATRLPPLTL